MRIEPKFVRPFALLASLATLAACGDAGPLPLAPEALTPKDASLARAADGHVATPWRGECATSFVPTGPTSLLITGTCQLAHLGRATLIAEQTLVPGPNGLQYTNTVTYTAANGDLLRTTNTGSALPTADGTGFVLTGVETAIGGTGRFSRAEGSATVMGTAYLAGPAAGTGTLAVEGTLRYAASDAAR
jgi:predicted small lipoprotein YifL